VGEDGNHKAAYSPHNRMAVIDCGTEPLFRGRSAANPGRHLGGRMGCREAIFFVAGKVCAHDRLAGLGVLALLKQIGDKPFRFFMLPLN
jgi:hypothetical protein